MSRICIPLAVLAALAVGFLWAFSAPADAQSFIPHFFDDDEEVACVQMPEGPWVAKLALKAELEAHTQQAATVQTMGAFLAQLPPATTSSAVRFEGGQPQGSVAATLLGLGYVTETIVPPALPNAGAAALRTQ